MCTDGKGLFILYNGRPFSTPDHVVGCAVTYKAGWWFTMAPQCISGLPTAPLGTGQYSTIWQDNLNRDFDVSSVSMFILQTDIDKGQTFMKSTI